MILIISSLIVPTPQTVFNHFQFTKCSFTVQFSAMSAVSGEQLQQSDYFAKLSLDTVITSSITNNNCNVDPPTI